MIFEEFKDCLKVYPCIVRLIALKAGLNEAKAADSVLRGGVFDPVGREHTGLNGMKTRRVAFIEIGERLEPSLGMTCGKP